MAFASLTIDLNARLANFERELTRTRQVAEKNASQIQAAFGKVTAGFGALAAGGAGIGFGELVKKALDSAAALDDLAESTGGSVEGLSKLVDVARISGGNLEGVQQILLNLNRALLNPSADENKGVGAALKSIGLSAQELLQQRPDERIETVARALAQFEDSGDKANVILTLFKKSAAETAPFLKDLAENLDRTGSLTAKQAADAERLQKEFGRLGVEVSNLARTLVADLAPGLADTLSKIRAFVQGAGGIDQSFAALTGGALRKSLPELKTDLGELQSLLDKQQKSFVGRNLPSVGVNITKNQIANVEAAIRAEEALRARQRDAALKLGEGAFDSKDVRAGLDRSRAVLDFKSTEGAPPAGRRAAGGGGGRASAISEGARLVQQIEQELARKQELSRVEEILLEIRTRGVRFESEAQRERAIGIAQQIDQIAAEKQFVEAIRQRLGPLEEEARTLRLQTQQFGLAREEIERYTAAQIGTAAAIARAQGVSDAWVETLEREARLRREIADSVEIQRGLQILDRTDSAQAEKAFADIAALQKAIDSLGLSAEAADKKLSEGIGVILGDGRLEKTKSIVEELGLTFSSAFEDAIAGGKGFSEILRGLEQDILRIITRKLVTEPLAQGVQSAIGSSGIGDLFSGLVGSIFGGARATGGPVSPGKAFLVGERGPELFMPSQPGQIVPQGGGGMSVMVNIQAQDLASFRASEGQIAATMQRAMARGRRNL